MKFKMGYAVKSATNEGGKVTAHAERGGGGSSAA